MRMYIEVFKIAVKNAVVYKLNTAINIFTNIVTLLVQIMLWRALLNNGQQYDVTVEQMTIYLTFGIFFGILYDVPVAVQVGDKIKDGSISMELIKPYYFSISMFLQSLGQSFSYALLRGIPLLLISFLFFISNFSISITNLVLLLIILSMNYFIVWLMFYIVGILHFELVNASWFIRILKDTLGILGGSVIPIWFFPQVLQNIVAYLPFQLLYSFPQSLLINKITSTEIIFNFSMSIFWILFLLFVSYVMWRVCIKKIVIQGG